MRVTTGFKTVAALAFLGVGATAVTSHAQSHHCNSISNSDQRNMCRARAEHASHHCNAISDSDTRNYCRAVSGGGASHCNSISDTDLRNRCRAEAGR